MAMLHYLSFFVFLARPPRPTLFPYTTLFRSGRHAGLRDGRPAALPRARRPRPAGDAADVRLQGRQVGPAHHQRSEEHTSELQSLTNIVCRLLLEKKKHVRTTFPIMPT